MKTATMADGSVAAVLPTYFEPHADTVLLKEVPPAKYESSAHSFLQVGKQHILSRDQVMRLVAHLQFWLDTGQLEYRFRINASDLRRAKFARGKQHAFEYRLAKGFLEAQAQAVIAQGEEAYGHCRKKKEPRVSTWLTS